MSEQMQNLGENKGEKTSEILDLNEVGSMVSLTIDGIQYHIPQYLQNLQNEGFMPTGEIVPMEAPKVTILETENAPQEDTLMDESPKETILETQDTILEPQDTESDDEKRRREKREAFKAKLQEKVNGAKKESVNGTNNGPRIIEVAKTKDSQQAPKDKNNIFKKIAQMFKRKPIDPLLDNKWAGVMLGKK